MKPKLILNALSLMAALAVTAGCQQKQQSAQNDQSVSGEQVKGKVNEAVNATKQYAAQTKDQVAAAVQKQLNAMDTDIAGLESKASKLTAQARTKADQALVELRAQRDVVAKKLDELKAAGQEDWKKAQSGLDEAWQKLQKTYEQAKQNFSN
ncbi:MAG: hypothetical protein M1608_08850 [Candidatus Omnitrophica bacterium]|nr:hypothetical protein [Candidatus Omnitrophota bacterium]